jgi:hypothetical protein
MKEEEWVDEIEEQLFDNEENGRGGHRYFFLSPLIANPLLILESAKR